MPADTELELLKIALDRFDKISGVWNLAGVIGGAIVVFLPNVKSSTNAFVFWLGLTIVGIFAGAGLMFYQVNITNQLASVKDQLKNSDLASVVNTIPAFDNSTVYLCGSAIIAVMSAIAAAYLFLLPRQT